MKVTFWGRADRHRIVSVSGHAWHSPCHAVTGVSKHLLYYADADLTYAWSELTGNALRADFDIRTCVNRCKFNRVRICSGYVRAFMPVAVQAGESEVVKNS